MGILKFLGLSKDGNHTGEKSVDSREYGAILARVAEKDTDISALKSKVAALELDVANLYRKMSQKLRDLQKEFNQDQEEKDLNSEYLPFG